MPYKKEGSKVFVKKGGKWRLLKDYGKGGNMKAQAYLRALHANVDHG